MSVLANRLIVVPIDMSEFSMKALRAAAEIVDDRDHLRIIHVLPILEPAEPGIIWSAVDDVTRIERIKETLRDFLKEHGYENLNIEIRLGDPGNEVTLYAEEIDAGLIVIPSHGRGVLTRSLLGSTTDRDVHLAQGPVLVLKEKPQTKNDAKTADQL